MAKDPSAGGTLMGNLQGIRKKFIAAAVALGLISVALVVYLQWPGSRHSVQQAKEAELRQKNAVLTREIALHKGSDPGKVQQALDRFYAENIATRGSQVSKQLEKIVQETGVVAQSIRYPDVTEKPPLPGVQWMKIETVVTGDYSKIARFIHSVEQDKMLFLIDKVSLNGLSGQQERGSVSLTITFTTFLREDTGARART